MVGSETVRRADYYGNTSLVILVLQDKWKMLGVPTISSKKIIIR